LSIYPFYYNVQTSEVRFYNQYTFDVETETSPVSVTAMTTDQLVYTMGAPVKVDIELENSGPAMDMTASAVIRRYGDQEVVANLLLQTLEDFSGKASFALNWDTVGFPAGSYQVEVNRVVQAFELGAMSGELHNLQVSPSWFQPGATLALSVQVHNPSSVPLNADLQLQAFDSLDQMAASFSIPVVELVAGESLDIETDWDTSGLPKDNYKIAAFLNYESSSSEPVYAWASSYQRVYLPVLMR
jgi:hypothetical protein